MAENQIQLQTRDQAQSTQFPDKLMPAIDETAKMDCASAPIVKTSRIRPSKVEWPTIGLFAAVYTSWILLLIGHSHISYWLLFPVMALLVTLHSSLQHEALHGHPFRNCIANMALAGMPIGIFIPYLRFKSLHLRHHCDENLTDPYDDPETFYRARGDWQALSWPMQRILMINNTLLGRLTIGPALSLFGFVRKELSIVLGAKSHAKRVLVAWGWHGLGLCLVLPVLYAADFPIWLYFAAVAYPGMSILMLRTFAEHEAAIGGQPKTAIVDASPFFGLLFLNNNLHCVHHSFPTAPWYRLPALYRENFLQTEQHPPYYAIKGYGSLFAKFAVRMRQQVPHPFRRLNTSTKNRSKS
ncbi:MAG: fatty acid desaturase [Rhizobiales bacterium]|nr:fatty acid desaturase [Hyphomicrobiales bacterium]